MSDRDLFEKAGEYRRRRAMETPERSGDAAPRLDVRALDDELDGLSAFATEAELHRSVPVEASPCSELSSPPDVCDDSGLAGSSSSSTMSAPKTPSVFERAAGFAGYAIRRVDRFEREIPSRVRQFRREQVQPLITRLEELHPIQAVRTQRGSRSSVVYGVLGLVMVAAATLVIVNGLRGWLEADEPGALMATAPETQTAIPSSPLATGDAAETSGAGDVSPSPPAEPPPSPVQEPDGPEIVAAAPPRDSALDSGVSLADGPPRPSEQVTSGSIPPETGSRASGGAPSESVRPLVEPAPILPAAAAPVTATPVPVVLAPPPPVTILPPPVTASLPAASTTTPPAASASPAAASRPPPTTAEPGVVTSATAPQVAIQSKLRQYADAFSALDAQRAKAVWPAVNERSLARAFAALEEQQVELGRCEISVTGATARASCEGTASYRPKVGNRSMRAEAREWTFRLQQNGADWSIADVQTR